MYFFNIKAADHTGVLLCTKLTSSVMPFAVVSMPDDHFESLQSDSLQGHAVVKHVGQSHFLSSSFLCDDHDLLYL